MPFNLKALFTKGGKKTMKGQATAGLLGLVIVMIVAIGLVLFIFTQLRVALEPQVTSPSVTYLRSAAEYAGDTQSETPTIGAQEVKAKILSDAGIPIGGAGKVTTQPDFSVEYIGGPDTFLVQITSTDLDTAKQQAEQWFVDQGFQPEDLCQGITVSFFIGSEARSSLPPGTQFNPVPSGC